jgi:hypothetical protein
MVFSPEDVLAVFTVSTIEVQWYCQGLVELPSQQC